MAEENQIAEVIGQTLGSFPLASTYASEQGDLQPDIQSAIDQSLDASFPESELQTTISVGGSGKPNLKLLGTSYWPDVEISAGDTGLVAIEVKLIQPGASASKPIAEAIGQAIIYATRYPKVFAFIANFGNHDENLDDEDSTLRERLSRLNIELIVRGTGEGRRTQAA